MAWAASVRVVDENGDPVSGAKVTVIFSLMSGYDTQYTDDDGWAEFEYEPIDSIEQMFVEHLAVNDEKVSGDFYMHDGDTYSFALP